MAQFIKGMDASNFSFSHQSRQFESWQMQLFFKKKYWYLHYSFLFISQQIYVQFNNINNTQTNKMFDLESYSFTGFWEYLSLIITCYNKSAVWRSSYRGWTHPFLKFSHQSREFESHQIHSSDNKNEDVLFLFLLPVSFPIIHF